MVKNLPANAVDIRDAGLSPESGRSPGGVYGKAREFQENIYFCFINYAKIFDCVDHSKLWKILQEMGITDHLTCLLKNLYAAQEAIVRTGRGITNWLHIGKGVCQGCILSPCLYEEYIMQMPGWMNHKLESRLPGEISINLRYADDTILRKKEKRN